MELRSAGADAVGGCMEMPAISASSGVGTARRCRLCRGRRRRRWLLRSPSIAAALLPVHVLTALLLPAHPSCRPGRPEKRRNGPPPPTHRQQQQAAAGSGRQRQRQQAGLGCSAGSPACMARNRSLGPKTPAGAARDAKARQLLPGRGRSERAGCPAAPPPAHPPAACCRGLPAAARSAGWPQCCPRARAAAGAGRCRV